MSKEDEIAMSLVEHWRENVDPSMQFDVTYEAHYNHYGNRGYVDIVVERESTVTLIEVKSASAVRNATGANEIIRQATKHATYYFEDHPTNSTKKLELVFEAHPDVWEHIKSNFDMYREFVGSVNDVNVKIRIRHPDEPGQLNPCHPAIGYHTDRWSEQLGLHDESPELVAAVTGEVDDE